MKKNFWISCAVIKLLILIFITSGCIQKDNDIFCVSDNYSDEEPIKAIVDNFASALNNREIDKLMSCVDENINFPDSLNLSINVTYRTLLYDYMDFFKKIESIAYEFNDRYIILSEHTAKVTLKLRKYYKAVSPFSYNVDSTVDETMIITKNSAGAWRITSIKELLPPRIY